MPLVLLVLLVGLAVALPLLPAAAAEEPRRTPSISDKVSGEVGADVVSKYLYNGILIEETGLIVQPYVAVDVTLLEGKGILDRVHLDGMLWSSLHTGPTNTEDATEAPRWWYELDAYAGAGITVFGGLDVTATYAWLSSPSGAFHAQEEMQFTLSFDDVWEDVRVFDRRFLGFKPEVTLAFETRGQSDGGLHQGTYLELGISPTFALLEEDEPSLELAFPITTGLSLGDYYEDASGVDHAFGYLEVGATFTYTFDDEEHGAPGAWDLVLGGKILFLGPSTTEYAEGEDVQGVASVGLHVRF